MDLKGKRVCVIGSGISGIGAVKLLNRVGANVTLYDGNDKLTKEAVEARLGNEKAEIIIGSISENTIKSFECAIVSPGVPVDGQLVLDFKNAGVLVWGEIELAYNYEAGQIIAITGTNGKTTTTALTGEIMKAAGKKTFVVGNIGNSYTAAVFETDRSSVSVAEISSFQLETVDNFHPLVTAILNITPDHLNRHHTMEIYAETKERIAGKQTEKDVCVLNYEDKRLREFGENSCKAKVIWFSSERELTEGAFVKDNAIYYAEKGEVKRLFACNEMNLLGKHNYENVCAAIAMTHSFGVDWDLIIKTVKEFKAVEHRIEYVTSKNDVYYYNDSKGTNPEASVKAVEAMVRPTLLIGGGFDKGSEFDEYVKAFKDKVKFLAVLGATADKLISCCENYGFKNYKKVESFEEAVELLSSMAKPGDAVLLSPACASWGMFNNYEERGAKFKELVNAL